MIRDVNPYSDSRSISEIYNHYIADTTVSFEVDCLSVEDMETRIAHIAERYPYYVFEVKGKIMGFCYAHPWKERAAYEKTLETTVYLSHDAKYQGIGRQLMMRLIEECRQRGYVSLIACITAENIESCEFHKRLGFEKVSHFHKVGYKFNRFLDVIDFQLIL